MVRLDISAPQGALSISKERFAVATSDKPVGATDMKRMAKLAISLLYFAAQELRRIALRAVGRSPKPHLTILYYHGVPTAFRSDFVRQLEAVQRGAQVFPAFHRGSLRADKSNVAITFDDAYVSVAENALPELAARGFHSTIFVPAGALGNGPTWPVENGSLDADETVMSAERIATLSSPLVTLGSHTLSHPRLSRLGIRDARREVEDSRLRLQALTGEDVRLLAFPYGDHDATTIELCRAAGYDHVFSIVPGPVDTTASDFVRGRVKADPFDGRLEFFLKYRGAYAWVPHVSSLKKKLGNWRPLRTRRRPLDGQPSPTGR
jgi:peptidoglycan/xylan/chitin deacetylase (PgdA/CDA1 family)